LYSAYFGSGNNKKQRTTTNTNNHKGLSGFSGSVLFSIFVQAFYGCASKSLTFVSANRYVQLHYNFMYNLNNEFYEIN